MKKIENLIAVTDKHVWTNWNRNWNIATIGKPGLHAMDAIVLQIQWEYCFTVSTNSLCQYLWNSVSSVLVCIPAEALVLKFVDYIFQNLRKYCRMPKTSNQVEKHLKCIVSEHHHGSWAVFCFCTRQTNCGTVSRFAATIIVPNGSKAIKLNDNCFLLDPK